MARTLKRALLVLEAEVKRARGLFPMDDCPVRVLPHFYLGVIEEEMHEFRKEVFAFNVAKDRDTRSRMREELIQVAAMAIRAYTEI